MDGDRIRGGRLDQCGYAVAFSDAHPALTPTQARVEAERCYYCYDAPCIEACPTGIDIPGFIARIADGNLRGSAETILRSNIFGGSCARVCPTEILCEQACVRTAQENKPVVIGALQRHATDWQMRTGSQPFRRAPTTGRRVAVVGAGPAGLACAHRLAMHGHEVVVFEAKAKGGGLNEYGIAAYKLPDEFAQRELEFILGVGGIEVRHGQKLGEQVTLAALRAEYDAVFLGVGQGAVRALSLPAAGASAAGDAASLAGVLDAVDFIRALRQAEDKATVPVGDRVVVIGGGNTAVDAAMQAKRLGAAEVTIAYRRGPEHMSATGFEQDWARTSNIRIRYWSVPIALHGADGTVTGIEFETAGGARELEPADMVLKAVGQLFDPEPFGEILAISGGRIAVDSEGRTSLPMVYAGGDCTAGNDLTVVAVAEGRDAAEAIHRALTNAPATLPADATTAAPRPVRGMEKMANG
ncbi:NAD(P)-dependent oxidoreductase [Rhizosaccharibacter radicis]|uniref:NAD(P)-dependent oxidoreductase n=1 Tax=Rhizosaccharibacter radicis TaxID=2782605 RepID=A0ABT1VX17_9PROT|nr:NAD(P)-dependent oxidoreductase [Acetobacteraceae bacterium KSS12]